MNMRRLSLSVLVITGLVLGSMPQQLQAHKPSKTLISFFAALVAINYILESKESVKNPEENYKWSDLLSLDWDKTVGAIDEKIIGQKAKGSSIKLTAGDKEIKGTSKTPATGLCGKGHETLTGIAKCTADTGKVLAAPTLLLAVYLGKLKLGEKDGSIVFTVAKLFKKEEPEVVINERL